MFPVSRKRYWLGESVYIKPDVFADDHHKASATIASTHRMWLLSVLSTRSIVTRAPIKLCRVMTRFHKIFFNVCRVSIPILTLPSLKAWGFLVQRNHLIKVPCSASTRGGILPKRKFGYALPYSHYCEFFFFDLKQFVSKTGCLAPMNLLPTAGGN